MIEFLQNFDLNAIGEFSPVALFFIFFFATFFSEDAACLAAGALAGQGRISFALALAACFAGIFVGDVLLYWIGRLGGEKVLRKRWFSRIVSESAVSNAAQWFEKRGAAVVFLSRFLVGLRLPTYLAAGFLRTNFPKFAFYLVLAAAIWTPILVGSTAFAGQFFFSKNLILLVIFSFIALRILSKFSSWKNRRLFIGKLKRIGKWEFWSLKIFYFPVVCYFVRLAFKHRSLNIFTCANPAILAGGFIGESKHEIYKNLIKSRANSDYLLRHIFLGRDATTEKKVSDARRFIDENDLNFPLVLKPDAGERGNGVKIIRNFSELPSELKNLKSDYLLQEYADGVEASIFYYRFPNAKKGAIFSVTEKRFPKLAGDGRATLETLILRDDRAVRLAKSYFDHNRERLQTIPAKGEKVQLIDIGTHSRGAIFVDGDWLKTEALENKIDEICRRFEGFYFGRFDIKAASFADLQAGKNFKIIELNGVTSESTNIYDPKYSLFDAYRILFAQWRIAFEIGAENAKLGTKPTAVLDLIRLAVGKTPAANLPISVNRRPLRADR